MNRGRINCINLYSWLSKLLSIAIITNISLSCFDSNHFALSVAKTNELEFWLLSVQKGLSAEFLKQKLRAIELIFLSYQ